jgi:glycosyltransferase 2 family protein
VLRPYLIARHHALRTSAAFASIILERLIDLITVLLLFGLYLYALPLPAAQQRGTFLIALRTAGAFAGLAALVALLLLVVLHLWSERVLAAFDRVLARLPRRLGGALSRGLRAFTDGLAVLQSPARHLLAIAGQSLLLWCSIALGVHWTNRAFGLDLPYHSAFLLLGFLTVGVAVPTPGMVGGFHVAYLQGLTQAFGVDPSTAAAAGLACHALSNLPVLVLGIVFLWREGLTLGGVARLADEQEHEQEKTPPPGGREPGDGDEAGRGERPLTMGARG